MADRRQEAGVPIDRGNANPLAEPDANPYASPQHEAMLALPEFAGGVYQMAGKWLVIHRTAALPQRCIIDVCTSNAISAGRVLREKRGA